MVALSRPAALAAAMTRTHHEFVSDHYSPRASAYLTSAVHASGADLDAIEAVVRRATGARVLDLGCGGGHVSYRVAPHVRQVVAVDLSEAMLAEVAQTAAARGLSNVAVQQSPAEALPFPDAHFDIVLSRFSCHHWHGWEAGLREAARVLKPGGKAVFADSIAAADPLIDTHLQAIELLRDVSHVRNYTAAEWAAALGRAGFAITAWGARRLRMEFPVWIARTGTSDVHAAAIRSLQAGASPEVREYLAIGDDGSFDIEEVIIETARTAG